MSKTTPVKIATKAFRATIDGHAYDVGAGERVVADHELIRRYPDNFRAFVLAEELEIRSARVSELREQATRPSTSEPLSRAGIAEREETRFWAQVDRDLHPRETPTREERFFDDALRQIERLDEARLREETDDFREMWAGRLPAER